MLCTSTGLDIDVTCTERLYPGLDMTGDVSLGPGYECVGLHEEAVPPQRGQAHRGGMHAPTIIGICCIISIYYQLLLLLLSSTVYC